jgi:hypothetical protein
MREEFDEFEEGTKLIWVYYKDSSLVNNRPFFGEKAVAKYIGKQYGIAIKPEWILDNCGEYKEEYFYHYLRTKPTKVFMKPRVKTKFRYV